MLIGLWSGFRRSWRTGEPHAASTPALALLAARGVPHTVQEYEIEAPSGPEAHRGTRMVYGAAAVAPLGVPPERLYKTLLITLDRQLCESPCNIALTQGFREICHEWSTGSDYLQAVRV